MNKSRKILLALAVAVSAAVPGRAQFFWESDLPEGAFWGASNLLKGSDVMTLVIRKDEANPKAAYAVLAEYTRTPIPPGPERLKLARWVPRVYAYHLEPVAEKRYALRPLRLQNGEIVFDAETSGVLVLDQKKLLKDAVLTRYEKGSSFIAERITFQTRASSRWEKLVVGQFYGSHDSTGADYLGKAGNMTIAEDGAAEFLQPDVKGSFRLVEKLPRMFVFQPAGGESLGADKILNRIGVFIDIVSWKPFFTTDELLLINPDDAKDVGFYYERH